MPNHITNVITINGVSEKRLNDILDAVQEEEFGRHSIDFNKIFPMPPELQIESGSRSTKGLELYSAYIKECETLADKYSSNLQQSDYEKQLDEVLDKYHKLSAEDPEVWQLGKQAYENIQKHGAPTWYEWCSSDEPGRWGSKWNAYSFNDVCCIHSDDNQIGFQTAWSSVPNIVERMSEMFPDAEFFYRWADEDIGCNLGERTYINGEITQENIPDMQSQEAFEMAADIIGFDLEEDYNFRFSEKEGTYIFVEEGDISPLMVGIE